MGSGVSSTSPPSTPEPQQPAHRNGNKPVAATKPISIEPDSTQRTLVRTNQVAPIIIKNCKEEYQHVTDFKDPIVYGRIAENMPEHALIKGAYFLIKDVTERIDRLGTMGQYLTPNMRRSRGGYPVYGMGQPSKDGLNIVLSTLKEEGHKDILLFNVREEPVLFVHDGYDMVPFSPRHQDRLHECVYNNMAASTESTDTEVQIRKETMDLASLKENYEFFFYSDLEHFKDDPHMFRVAYEDDLAVTDEIYSRHSFNNSGIRYLRIPLPPEGAPLEQDFDDFVDMFRLLPNFFDCGDPQVPAVVITSHAGTGRTTLAMVLGCLMLAHKRGFPQEALKNPIPINAKSPNFERGEFFGIQQLVQYFHHGLKIKHQVDVLIDMVDELHNLRSAAAESKKNLESITEDYIIDGQSAVEHFRKLCLLHLERYFYLICFNAYLHEQFGALFGTPFTQWMQQQPHLYTLLRHMDISERQTSPDLLIKEQRILVADEHAYLDVLSSQMDVKTSNFRRVSGLPVYGMAQPSREGLSGVLEHLLDKRQGHPLVVIFNLREDIVLECNGATYSWREAGCLEEPIILPGISASQIEEKEEQMKKVVKTKKNFSVYEELDRDPVNKEFNSVLTPSEMIEQVKMQKKEVLYHRIPMGDDFGPAEKDFDKIMEVINHLEEVYTDEDGPALVFHCRTGKGRTTTAMAIAGLVFCHKKGFPYGTKPGEEERVSLPNAGFTKGNYRAVEELIRRIPNGQQVKREVDFILDQCSDTMTPMHYHIREVIFVTYNKVKKAKNEEEKRMCKRRCLEQLERYVYLILFNTYLHCERRSKWKRLFSTWMKEVASKAGVYDLLDNLSFPELDHNVGMMKMRRVRWGNKQSKLPFKGAFV